MSLQLIPQPFQSVLAPFSGHEPHLLQRLTGLFVVTGEITKPLSLMMHFENEFHLLLGYFSPACLLSDIRLFIRMGYKDINLSTLHYRCKE